MNTWIQHIKFYSWGWLFASVFFYLLRQAGIAYPNGKNLLLPHFLLLLPILAIVPGIIFGSLQYFFEKNIKRKTPLPVLLLRIFLVQLIAISIFSFAYYFFLADESFLTFITSTKVFVFNFYVFIANLYFAFLVEIIRLIGRSNFIKLVTGRFYSPKEEYRIFMFIDLNSSTGIAEKLGHIAYSHFIKDCYSDLDVVDKFDTEIYQYVGDEVVFTWQRSKTRSIDQCIDAFWAYSDKLSARAPYYNSRYGVVPEFKAGMSIGMVTVVEIGEFKKEIAYHGNTLNTTSRVVELCNIYAERLLITRKVFEEIQKEKSKYSFKKVTETQLRGKKGLTEIFGVRRPLATEIPESSSVRRNQY